MIPSGPDWIGWSRTQKHARKPDMHAKTAQSAPAIRALPVVRKDLVHRCLDGLSLGDAFGERFFKLPFEGIRTRTLPEGTWRWTDDTAMALSVAEIIVEHGRIEQDALAAAFARRYAAEPWRGYGGGAMHLLTRLAMGADWRIEAPALFEGGSYGNGAAMRAAPVGAAFPGMPALAAAEARRQAEITHAHPDGQAGAMAVAAAAAIAAHAHDRPAGPDFVAAVVPHVPPGEVRRRLELARDIASDRFGAAARALGTGAQVAAHDTVPFAIWAAAGHLDDFAEAMWTTVAGLGDRDTTCAIVGGLVALCGDIPPGWLERREKLPR